MTSITSKIKDACFHQVSVVCLPKKRYANLSELCDLSFQFLTTTLGTSSVLLGLGYDRKIALNFALTLASTSFAVSVVGMALLGNQQDIELWTEDNKKVTVRSRPASITVMSFASQIIAGLALLRIYNVSFSLKLVYNYQLRSNLLNATLYLIYTIAKRKIFMKMNWGKEVPLIPYVMGIVKSERPDV